MTAQPFATEVRTSSAKPCYDALKRIACELDEWFEVKFSVIDTETGEFVQKSQAALGWDWLYQAELCREVARRGRPEFIEDDDHLLVLAIPLPLERVESLLDSTHRYVALATFVNADKPAPQTRRLAARLGISEAEATAWAKDQAAWRPERLLKMAELAIDKFSADRRFDQVSAECEKVSENLSATYEEISLHYRLTENLKISDDVDELAGRVLEWLHAVVPAKSLAIELNMSGSSDQATPDDARKPALFTRGPSVLDDSGFDELVNSCSREINGQPFVLNAAATEKMPWNFSKIRELVLVPLCEGDKTFGYLAAFNHDEDGEFGTVEASLMNSVATILGVHCGNIELYHEQAELLAGVVRALSSAIDAKDPYTCGHSDRVARVAVRLAQELELSQEFRNTVYLSGLLHDVGKIGISDEVLRKPGKLTPAEYEHIKLHPGLGHMILKDIKKIENVLPGVLHHHESWDGSGYPDRLDGERIPLLARIIAVADAFDAMGSDRPYRQGMDDEKLDSILRSGAGRQWDARVIDAFFAARDEILEISHSENESLQLDTRQWT